MKTKEANLKVYNFISAVFFFLSSITLLFIPFIDIEDGLPNFAYFIAGLFWIGIIGGMTLQIFLWNKTKTKKNQKTLKKTRFIILATLAVSIITIVLASTILKINAHILSIALFTMVLSVESFYVVKIIEKIS